MRRPGWRVLAVLARVARGAFARPSLRGRAALACAGLAWLALAAVPCPVQAAVDVEARLSMGSIEAGGTVALMVTVTDPRGTVGDPQFNLPAGIELLGSSRQQQFSWINGRSTNQVMYRFELGAARPGRL